jgi:hypothetical protein
VKIAYKLCRQKKNGDITSLFINKTERLEFNEWLEARCFPTKGFAVRPFWHCTSEPVAPHLSEKGRVWVKVQMDNFEEFQRPQNQGGLWFLAKRIKLLETTCQK